MQVMLRKKSYFIIDEGPRAYSGCTVYLCSIDNVHVNGRTKVVPASASRKFLAF